MSFPSAILNREAAEDRRQSGNASGPIIVATDATSDSDSALLAAWSLVGRTASDVQVISVIEPLVPIVAIAGIPPMTAEFLAEQRDAQLAAVRSQLARVIPGCEWPVAVTEGKAAEVIAGQAHNERARLLVMGRGRHGLAARALGGETVRRVLSMADTPVLATEPGAASVPRRAVIAMDFSAYSVFAAQVALALIATDAVVYLVHVRPRARFTGPGTARWERTYDDAVPALLDAVRDRLGPPDDMQVERIALTGAPAASLVEFARSANADLIVAGTHGYGFLDRLVLGSVATELLRTAPCSLLCVPGSALTRGSADEALPLARTSVPRSAWRQTLERFSDRQAGRRCRLDWDEPGEGGRVIGSTLKLIGADYDERDNAVRFMFGAAELAGEHATHVVSNVHGMDQLCDSEGAERGLSIIGDSTLTTVRVTP